MTELRNELLDAVFDRLEESPQWLAKVAAEGGYDWNPALRGAGVGAVAGASIAGFKDLLSSKKPSEEDEEDSHSPMLRALKNMGVGALAGGAIGGAGAAGWNMFQGPAEKFVGNTSGDDAPGPAAGAQPAGTASTGATPQAPAPLPQWQGDLSALIAGGFGGGAAGAAVENLSALRGNRIESLAAARKRLTDIANAMRGASYDTVSGEPGAKALRAVQEYARKLPEGGVKSPLWKRILTLGQVDSARRLARNPEALLNRLSGVAREELRRNIASDKSTGRGIRALIDTLRANADKRTRVLRGTQGIREAIGTPVRSVALPSQPTTKAKWRRGGTIGAGIPIGLLLYNMLSRKPVSETLGGSQ